MQGQPDASAFPLRQSPQARASAAARAAARRGSTAPPSNSATGTAAQLCHGPTLHGQRAPSTPAVARALRRRPTTCHCRRSKSGLVSLYHSECTPFPGDVIVTVTVTASSSTAMHPRDREWGGRRGTPALEFPEPGLALPSARGGERERRQALAAGAHLQPRVTPRAVQRSGWERGANGAPVPFVGEPTPRDASPRSRGGYTARDQLRDPESARRQASGMLRRAPSCHDPKTHGWDSAAQGLSEGQAEARPRYACPTDKPSRVRGRAERDLVRADPNAVVDALHGVPRPRVRGTGRDVRDIVQPNQLMPWSKSEAQRVFLRDATPEDYNLFKRVSERVFASLRYEQDCARVMRSLDPRGSGLLAVADFARALHSINLVISPEELARLVQRLHSACKHYAPNEACFQGAVARTVSIDFFLLIFDADQRAIPGCPGDVLKGAPAPPPISRVASVISRIPSGASKAKDVLQRASSAPTSPPRRQRAEAWTEDRKGGGDAGGGGGAHQRRRSTDSVGSDEVELPVWEAERTCSDAGDANVDPSAEFSRQRYLRDIVAKAGGSSQHYRLVRKLNKHFEETHLDVEKFMRGGDLRGAGRLRRREFKQAC